MTLGEKWTKFLYGSFCKYSSLSECLPPNSKVKAVSNKKGFVLHQQQIYSKAYPIYLCRHHHKKMSMHVRCALVYLLAILLGVLDAF